jgi:hypothetical protein
MGGAIRGDNNAAIAKRVSDLHRVTGGRWTQTAAKADRLIGLTLNLIPYRSPLPNQPAGPEPRLMRLDGSDWFTRRRGDAEEGSEGKPMKAIGDPC